MNRWIALSIEYANRKDYLDKLSDIYPMVPGRNRNIDKKKRESITVAFNAEDKIALITHLLYQDLFPIKDSYVAFLKRDHNAIERNPEMINRLYDRLHKMGLDKIFEKCSEPKETNRQMGPLFKRWVNSKALGIAPVGLHEFMNTSENAILNATDPKMKSWAKEYLGYNRNKGLDFVARFNGKYVIGEAKFLTDLGGHQNAQFQDAMQTITTSLRPGVNAIKIAILDGVLYIKRKNKMYTDITETYSNENILSALLLRDFLYSI